MTYEITRDGEMARDEARALTDKVKLAASELWADLLKLYNGNAHKALGYKSWAAYCQVEFDLGRNAAWRMLNAARVMDQLPNGERSSPIGDTSPAPKNEAVARELVPAMRNGNVAETWADVVEQHGPEPTAKQVREVVRDRKPTPIRPVAPAKPADHWSSRMALLAGELRYIANAAQDTGPDRDVHDHIATALELIDLVRPVLADMRRPA